MIDHDDRIRSRRRASELRPDDNTNRPGQFGIGRHGQRDMISSDVIVAP